MFPDYVFPDSHYLLLKISVNCHRAFKLGGRDNFDEVRVFQQERDGIRKFNNKGILVYKR